MAALRPTKRLTAFRDMLAQSLNETNDAVDYSFTEDDFTARVKGRRVGKLALAEATTSGHMLRRDLSKARKTTEEGLLLGLNLDRPISYTQDGREDSLAAGDCGFVANSRPYEQSTREVGRRLYLQFPKQELVDRFGPIDDLTSTTFSAKLPVHRLAMRFLTDIQEIFGHVDDFTAERLVAQGLDLLALAMREQVGGTLPNTTTHRSAVLFRLKSFIMSRLRDPTLSLSDAALSFGVSPRYINRLLAIEQTSFGRFVLEKRLQACRRDLGDPAHLSTNIIDIAFGWGFNDVSHFSRAFKARFGLSPRDYRQQRHMELARSRH